MMLFLFKTNRNLDMPPYSLETPVSNVNKIFLVEVQCLALITCRTYIIMALGGSAEKNISVFLSIKAY